MNSDDNRASGARADAMFAELDAQVREPLPAEPFLTDVRRGIVRGARYRAALLAVGIGAGLVMLMPLLAQLAAGLQPLLGQALDVESWRPRDLAALVSEAPAYLWAIVLGGSVTVGVLAMER